MTRRSHPLISCVSNFKFSLMFFPSQQFSFFCWILHFFSRCRHENQAQGMEEGHHFCSDISKFNLLGLARSLERQSSAVWQRLETSPAARRLSDEDFCYHSNNKVAWNWNENSYTTLETRNWFWWKAQVKSKIYSLFYSSSIFLINSLAQRQFTSHRHRIQQNEKIF